MDLDEHACVSKPQDDYIRHAANAKFQLRLNAWMQP